MEPRTEADAVAELAEKARGYAYTIPTAGGREFLIVPEGHAHHDVTDPHGAPAKPGPYVKQTVTLQAVDSLVEYVNRFKGGDTVLFADIVQSSIAALLDYHGQPAKPAHVAHRAVMQLPFSEEWKTWTGINNKLMPQLEFARFIEENAADVLAPSAADLLEVARDLQVKRKVNFVKAVRTSSDNENFEYSEEVNATSRRGELEIPTKFVLHLPVYFGEPPVELHAFLRWRLDDSALTLGIALHRAEHVRQAMFKQIVLLVGDKTECPVVFGKAG